MAHRYTNYYDILNAFYLIVRLNSVEHHLLRVLMIPFPLIESKFKTYINFLDRVVRTMRLLKKKYGLIQFTVSGKLAGGRKRTKVKSFGFGKFPKNSYHAEMTHLFARFVHKYGEFGVKLVMGIKRKVKKHRRAARRFPKRGARIFRLQLPEKPFRKFRPNKKRERLLSRRHPLQSTSRIDSSAKNYSTKKQKTGRKRLPPKNSLKEKETRPAGGKKCKVLTKPAHQKGAGHMTRA
jgi:hypothetical protein